MNVAFIGLGKMGVGMARNLLRAGHTVTVFNRTRQKAEEVFAAGSGSPTIADSIEDAVRGAEAVLTMLSDDHALQEVVFGDGRRKGVAETLPARAVHISCSTISTELARRLTTAHAERNQQYVSAPVFGRPEAAEAKKLLVVAAGPAETIDGCRPIFDALGRQTFIAGDLPWQANAVKLSGNFMIASMIETFGEAFATLRKAGVEPKLFLEVMNSLFGSPVYANYGRMIAGQEFEPPGFALRLGLKDVRLMLDTALECKSPMPMASLIRDQFLSAMANGQSEEDWSAVVRIAARNSGL